MYQQPRTLAGPWLTHQFSSGGRSKHVNTICNPYPRSALQILRHICYCVVYTFAPTSSPYNALAFTNPTSYNTDLLLFLSQMICSASVRVPGLPSEGQCVRQAPDPDQRFPHLQRDPALRHQEAGRLSHFHHQQGE